MNFLEIIKNFLRLLYAVIFPGTERPVKDTPEVIEDIEPPKSDEDSTEDKNVPMANFYIAAEKSLLAEGGYSTDRTDNGNWVCYPSGGWVEGESGSFYCPDGGEARFVGTMRGIAAPNLAKWLGYVPSVSRMKAVTEAEALQIYKAFFWDKLKGDHFFDQYVANIVFDHGLNSHTTQAAKQLQRILNVTDDGIIGPVTLTALNDSDPAAVYVAFKQSRLDYYNDLVRRKPWKRNQLQGWKNRVAKFTAYSSDDIQMPISRPNNGGGLLAFIIVLATIKVFGQ